MYQEVPVEQPWEASSENEWIHEIVHEIQPWANIEVLCCQYFSTGWINIEDGEHLLYCVKGRISLSAHVFNNKVQNWLIIYLEGQKRNLSHSISKLKEP